MANTGIFAHRSGRVISLSRLALATAFTVLIWVDPSQPRGPEDITFILLGAYIVWSTLALAVTWSSWRWDNRLANIAHVVDVGMFGILVFLTEGYTSPYFTFFVFLLLSSAIRWSWRETALTALAILILFVTAGSSAAIFGDAVVDPFPIVMRCLYLVILSALFIWFGINQDESALAIDRPPVPAPLGEALTAQMLDIVATRLNASRLVLAWSDDEEPWLQVTALESGEIRHERFAPDRFGDLIGDEANAHAFLFNAPRNLGLRRRDDDPHRFAEFAQSIDPDFAAQYDLVRGLVVRIRSDEGSGELFVVSRRRFLSDDIVIAERLGVELSAMVDRSAAMAVSEEEAVRRAKASLARDLHDGVIQSLTGASLKLAGVRTALEKGEDVRDELDSIRHELVSEQRQVRTFIESLRSGRGPTRRVDLSSGLPYISEELSERWNLICAVTDRPAVEGPVWLEHDLHQMVREAAANAVRHGGATSIEIDLGFENGGIGLCITDNGKGFARSTSGQASGEEAVPRSLRERTEGLGGRIEIEPTAQRCQTRIWVPLHESR